MSLRADPEQTIIVPWLVFDLIGQYSLLFLIITYAVAGSLPQRKNPYLVNLVVATFISTIPPALLLYGGVQFKNVPMALCLAQGIIMDALMPMVFVAQLALVFDNWSELQSLALHKPQVSRQRVIQWLLIASPYFFLIIFLIASALGATKDPQNLQDQGRIAFVYCRNNGSASAIVKAIVGIFLGIFSVIHLVFEIWVIWMIYAYPTRVQDDPTSWRTTIQFALRLIIFSSLQFLTILISIINMPMGGGPMKRTYELLTAMNGLATFIAFGTQTSVLLVWKGWLVAAWNFILRRKEVEEDPVQPYGLPVTDWNYTPWRGAYLGSKHSSMSSGTDISAEEKGITRLLKPKGQPKRSFPRAFWKK